MPTAAPNVFARHNHRQCRTGGMVKARLACENRGVRLTPTRSRVLEILLESHKALGAYEILERLNKDGLGNQPPVAYRALGFLIENGFAHKIERLNAYTACVHEDGGHEPMFLICTGCQTVAEADTDPCSVLVEKEAATLGFLVQSRVVEVLGQCALCQKRAAG